ncbi:hypothetical protein KC19_11G143600 [Ceratodon purpureus]|uniref:Myb-like domain-containing protein n=1 Tax=Ceratodon purpureus TaxID=3225 RepID=A0A8T0GEZ8_CERPU|nr:hypothetical protein KC19_11G143600 [Ceratodon purpureus]
MDPHDMDSFVPFDMDPHDMDPFVPLDFFWSPANTETGGYERVQIETGVRITGTSAQHHDTLVDLLIGDSASLNVCQEDILPNPQPIAVRKPKKRLQKFSKWNESETSVLLDLMVERGRIRKGTAGGTHWGQISKDIQMKFGTIRSEDECRRRYDTLLKAYKKIKSTGKEYCDITDAELSQANLATCLTEKWYKAIDIICLKRGSDNSKFLKRAKLNPSDGNGTLSSSPRNPAAPPVSFECSEAEKPSPKQVAIPGFSTLDEDLRFTILNLIQALLMKKWSERNRRCFDDPTVFELEVLCQWLAIVQDRRPLDIYIFMIKLFKLKLLNIECAILKRSSGPEMKDGLISKERICLKHLRVYKRFLDKVKCKNPDFDNYLEICNNHDSVSFPKAPSSLPLQQIRVLSLYNCQELKQADLSNFPELRSLAIEGCDNLEEITGWEVVKELGWLEIRSCRSCKDFPCVQWLPSLRELCFGSCGSLALRSALMPDFSQCVQLRRLEILENNISAMNMMDLSQLRFLEVLTLGCCCALTTIQGLSGLHSLTQLDLSCDALTRLPELGSLKSLTHLDLGSSGIEEISGVQELHMLTTLSLQYCHSLKRLPCLGRSKRLVYLDIRSSGVDEIPGVQDLVGLETLCCSGSRLKWLPDLHHLPRLQRVEVSDTPLSRMDPSSFYYGKGRLLFNSKEERKGFVDDISDISDSDEDSG